MEYRVSKAQPDQSLRQPDWLLGLKQALESDDHTQDLFQHYKVRFEKTLAQTTLDECNGNQSKAAKRLGISRNTLARFLSMDTDSI